MMPKIPNLELLEYQAKQIFLKDEECMELLNEERNKHSNYIFYLECEVFLQTWSSTCTGFDVLPNGEPAWGGDAITDAYTTVFKEELLGVYIVFIDNEPCYVVHSPSKDFFDDLKNKKLKSLSYAEKYY